MCAAAAAVEPNHLNLMPTLFRRHSNIQCFFCQSQGLHLNPHNFKCTSCGCWNRYDNHGEIISDEPAMHEEHLNSKSFAKRGRSYLCQNETSVELAIASPSKDRLPTMYGSGPFCHSCQTNQMLIVNLLSNYLPSQEVHATFFYCDLPHILRSCRVQNMNLASKCSLPTANPSTCDIHRSVIRAFRWSKMK